uniref:Ovule protein n=1 Tax=Steinernema glaseri TaxID=37863 RepID=A0A1I7XZB1_9BILA
MVTLINLAHFFRSPFPWEQLSHKGIIMAHQSDIMMLFNPPYNICLDNICDQKESTFFTDSDVFHSSL